MPELVIGFRFNGIPGGAWQFFAVQGGLTTTDTEGSVLTYLDLRVVPLGNTTSGFGYGTIIVGRNVDVGIAGRATVYVFSAEKDFELFQNERFRLYADLVVDLAGVTLAKVSGSPLILNPEYIRIGGGLHGEALLGRGFGLRLDLQGKVALPVLPAEALSRLTLAYRTSRAEFQAFVEASVLAEYTRVREMALGGEGVSWGIEKPPIILSATAGLAVIF